jgi:hypothetical protein
MTCVQKDNEEWSKDEINRPQEMFIPLLLYGTVFLIPGI